MIGYKKLTLCEIAAKYSKDFADGYRQVPTEILLFNAYLAGMKMGKKLAKQEQEKKA